MKNKYYHIKHYTSKLESFKKTRRDFELISTSYTKKIITENETIFFNDEGSDDVKTLLLISAVRRDAKKFLETNTIEDVNCEDTDFFNLLDVIKEDEVIVKVDLKSAYWEFALKNDPPIISQETNEKFLKWYENVDTSYAKYARLKALGSLATSKLTSVYKNGRFHYNKPVETQPTKALYMAICNGIDKLMKDVNYNVDGCVYYYWDCIFVQKEFEKQVVDYIGSRGYSVSTQETKLEFVNIGDIGYLLSTSDDKIYMTRKENKFLLEFEEDDY